MLALMDAAFPGAWTAAMWMCSPGGPFGRRGSTMATVPATGVGAMLSVHEGPARINYGQQNTLPFQPGIVISDEPGLYFEGEHGVRMENLVECVELPTRYAGLCPLDHGPHRPGCAGPRPYGAH